MTAPRVLAYPSTMLASLIPAPGGPDLCALTGYCSTGGAAPGLNLLFLASTLLVAGVIVARQGRKKP